MHKTLLQTKISRKEKARVSPKCPKCNIECVPSEKDKPCDEASNSSGIPKPSQDNGSPGDTQTSSTPGSLPSTETPFKTVGKTKSRCVVCRQRVAAGCTNITKDAQIDFLIRFQTLIPDGSRICKKHLIGKHLKTDITPLSIEKNEMSNEKLQQALTLLLEQRESKSSPINFDGEMNYHTWTGIISFFFYKIDSIPSRQLTVH